MINIEALIYSSGSIAILLFLSLVIVICFSAIVLIMTRILTKELRSLYLHAQLLHFMGKLKNNGISSLKSDAEKFGYKIMSKDCEK